MFLSGAVDHRHSHDSCSREGRSGHAKKPRKALNSREKSGGAGRSRTALKGFAGLCITALLPRPDHLPIPAVTSLACLGFGQLEPATEQ